MCIKVLHVFKVLQGFLQCLNTIHPNLKFRNKKSKISVNVLDAALSRLMVISWRQIFVISLLIFISFLNLTFYMNPMVYSPGLCIKMLCFFSFTFEKHLESKHSWFRKCGYSKKLLENQLRRIVESRPEH